MINWSKWWNEMINMKVRDSDLRTKFYVNQQNQKKQKNTHLKNKQTIMKKTNLRHKSPNKNKIRIRKTKNINMLNTLCFYNRRGPNNETEKV